MPTLPARDPRSRSQRLFEAEYRRKALERQATQLWESIDLLALPITPTVCRVAERRAEPVRLNSALGRYTNFVTLLDMSALALATGFRTDGTGFGITLISPADADLATVIPPSGAAPAAVTRRNCPPL